MVKKLIVVKHINKFIRKKLGMRVSSKIYDKIEENVKETLISAKKRAELDKSKSILDKHI